MRSLSGKWILRTASVCAVSACFSVAASAAAINIDDRADDPAPILVGLNDFEGGFFINGVLAQQGLNNPTTTPVPGESFNFDGRWQDNGLSTPLSRTVYFVEEGTPNVISDILQYTVETDGFNGHIFGSYTSDSDPGGLGTVPGGTNPNDIWVEGSGDFFFSAAFLSGVVQTVPEPASILMLILGGAALLRRRN